MKLVFKLSLLLSATLATPSLSANSMQDVFNAINAQGNVTSPGVIQGQTMNYATGGSLFMRTPRKTYQLASMSMPSMSLSSCGGIDLYAGGMGFINKDEFVGMLRNIGSNALSYGFKLALQNMCPTCDNVMQALQTTSQAINRLNIDSCEAAKGIVNAATKTMDLKGREQSAISLGAIKNDFSSVSDAWRGIKNSPSGSEQASQPVIDNETNRDPNAADHLPSGNLVWKSLKKVQGIDDEYRMMLMSIAGTTIHRKAPDQPITLIPTVTNVQDILGQSGQRKVKILMLRCADGTAANQCLDVRAVETELDSFSWMVSQKLSSIVDHISQRRAYPQGQYDDFVGFVNTTDLPIYKIIAVGTRLNNSTIADAMLHRYQEYIAARYAYAYLELAVKDLNRTIAAYARNTSDAGSEQDLNKISAQLHQTLASARQAIQLAYTQSLSTYNIAQEVAHIERVTAFNLSQNILNSLSFGSSLR